MELLCCDVGLCFNVSNLFSFAGTVLCESDARMALAEPVSSVAYCNSALQGSCEVAGQDVLLNSSPRLV